MPELPEVRTVAQVLKKLINKKIARININYSKIINQNSLDIKLLIGKTLKDINTIGKYLLFDFEEYILISHLRMEGKYYIKDLKLPLNKHEHIEFVFSDNISLRYHDTRKFGRMLLIKHEDLNKVESIAKLGSEPFTLSKEEFYNKINKKKIPIKSLLLDQTIIAGLGNIYANEVLFASKINPFKLGTEIALEEAEAILSASIKILNLAIKEKGTTIKSYTSSLNVVGNYQKHLKVHLKSGKKCEVCQSEILKTKIGGRSTYYCLVCQK